MKMDVKVTGTYPGGHCEDCKIQESGPRPNGDVVEITVGFENHRSGFVVRLCEKHARRFSNGLFEKTLDALAKINTQTPVWGKPAGHANGRRNDHGGNQD